MVFRNFIYTEDDDDFAFLPIEPSPGFGTDSGESSKAGMFIVHPGSVASRIKARKCKKRRGSSRPSVKRKLASGSSSSRVVRAQTSASKDDAPILSISDDDQGKSLVYLVLSEDNAVNKRSREFLQVIKKMRGEADVIKARERSREEECDELRVKCKVVMVEFDQNPVVLALREKISSLTVDVKEHKEVEKARLEAVKASLHREVEELKQDRRDVVSKVVIYAAMELVYSDELGRLVGYSSSYKKEHTQASNDFATAMFPWMDEFIADATALIKALLLKKPPTLQKPAPLRTQMPMPSSQKATPSSAPSSNLMSPLADLMKPFPSLFE
uniref:Uncharacterized protein n=1 Tax=Tanacetum cinerariifolium TaxID=118510 RepID=A0A6L2MNZ9_TANCI|nr:hypothetical protein [Tanacetum cinerariifolium]